MNPRKPLARLSWGVADQAVASGNNLLIVVLAAQLLGIEDLGRFSVLLSLYLVTLLITRGRISEPLLLQAQCRPQDIAASVLAVALLSGGCGLAALIALVFDPRPYVVLFAIALPVLAVQDHLRLVCFQRRRGRIAFASDTAWVLTQSVALVGIALTGTSSLTLVTLSWVLGGGVALLVALQVQGTILLDPRPWLREHRRMGLALAADNLLAQGFLHVSIILVSLVAGLGEAGVLRLGLAAFGPVTVLALAVRSTLLPELARLHDQPGVLNRSLSVLAWVLASIGLGWGLLLLLLPQSLGILFFSSAWLAATSLVLPLAVERIAGALALKPMLALRLGKQSKLILAIRVLAICVSVPMVLLGTVLMAAEGAAIALAVSSVTGLLLWELGLKVSNRRRNRAPSPEADAS